MHDQALTRLRGRRAVCGKVRVDREFDRRDASFAMKARAVPFDVPFRARAKPRPSLNCVVRLRIGQAPPRDARFFIRLLPTVYCESYGDRIARRAVTRECTRA